MSERPAHLNCGWCGKRLDREDTQLTGRVRCARCRVATTSPWPTDAELDAAYGGWYRPEAEKRFSGVGDRLLRWTRGTLARRIDRNAPAGPVLDVGAGDGTLIRALRSRGREAVGLERGRTGAEFDRRDISEVQGEWAAIVFWHSLEHMRSPTASLHHALRLLKPGGLLVLALPNADSWQAQLFGDQWLALDMPRHLVHVPARTLVDTLGDLGCRVERVSHYRGGQVGFGWAHGLVSKAPGRLDLYAAVRSPAAREQAVSNGRRVATLALAVIMAPVAAVATAVEVAGRRGGSVYVEARA